MRVWSQGWWAQLNSLGWMRSHAHSNASLDARNRSILSEGTLVSVHESLGGLIPDEWGCQQRRREEWMLGHSPTDMSSSDSKHMVSLLPHLCPVCLEADPPGQPILWKGLACMTACLPSVPGFLRRPRLLAGTPNSDPTVRWKEQLRDKERPR